MPNRHAPKMSDAEVITYIRQGLGTKKIHEITGIHVAHGRICRLRDEHGIVFERPNLRAIVLESFGHHNNIPDLSRANGMTPAMTHYYLAPILKNLRAAGTLHNCTCGKPAYHQSACNKADKDGKNFVTDELLVSLLRQGFRRDSIAIKTGRKVSEKRFARLRSAHGIGERGPLHPRMKRTTQRAKNLGNQSYDRVCRALRHMTDPQLRDDARSEMFLDLSTGKLSTDDIESKARSYSGAAIAEWQSRYGPRSLDEVRFDDGDATLLDSLEDESALAAFDNLFEPEEDGLDCWN